MKQLALLEWHIGIKSFFPKDVDIVILKNEGSHAVGKRGFLRQHDSYLKLIFYDLSDWKHFPNSLVANTSHYHNVWLWKA